MIFSRNSNAGTLIFQKVEENRMLLQQSGLKGVYRSNEKLRMGGHQGALSFEDGFSMKPGTVHKNTPESQPKDQSLLLTKATRSTSPLLSSKSFRLFLMNRRSCLSSFVSKRLDHPGFGGSQKIGTFLIESAIEPCFSCKSAGEIRCKRGLGRLALYEEFPSLRIETAIRARSPHTSQQNAMPYEDFELHGGLHNVVIYLYNDKYLSKRWGHVHPFQGLSVYMAPLKHQLDICKSHCSQSYRSDSDAILGKRTTLGDPIMDKKIEKSLCKKMHLKHILYIRYA